MNTNLQKAQDMLFGKGGLGVSNIKLFPGNNREATPEELAGEVLRVVTGLVDQPRPEAVAGA